MANLRDMKSVDIYGMISCW